MFIRVCYGQGMFGVCFMFLFSFCFCRLIKVARRSSGVHLFVLITNLVCVGVTLLRGAPVYFYVGVTLLRGAPFFFVNLKELGKPTEPQRCAN